jgi:hypothetical protein
VEVLEDGTPRVRFDGARRPVAARAMDPLDAPTLRAAAARGAEVYLVFDRGDAARPIIAGVLAPVAGPGDAAPRPAERARAARTVLARVDGERVAIEAEQEIVLTCGKASITLRANGRVVIRGTQVDSRAAGVNKVRGGTVQIN